MSPCLGFPCLPKCAMAGLLLWNSHRKLLPSTYLLPIYFQIFWNHSSTYLPPFKNTKSSCLPAKQYRSATRIRSQGQVVTDVGVSMSVIFSSLHPRWQGKCTWNQSKFGINHRMAPPRVLPTAVTAKPQKSWTRIQGYPREYLCSIVSLARTKPQEITISHLFCTSFTMVLIRLQGSSPPC